MRQFLNTFIGFIIFLIPHIAFSQTMDNDSLPNHEKDLKDILQNIFKHKKATNLKPKKNFQLSAYPAIGYSTTTSLAASVGASALYTLHGASKQSTLSTSITYTLNEQTLIPFQANLWAKGDKFNIIFDYRYINFPSDAFGLRGRKRTDSSYSINFQWLKLHTTVLTRIANNFYIGAGINVDHFWNINEEDLSDTSRRGYVSAFEYYVKKKIPPQKQIAVGPSVKLLFDSRDNPINASKGTYLSGSFQPYMKGLGSDNSWINVILEGRKYFHFSEKKQSVLALWSYIWQSYGKVPFLMLPSTGWDEYWNTGRGTPQGRFRGKSMQYLEAEYRFQISKNGLIGGVVFTNFQNFSNELFTSFSDYRGRKSTNVAAVGAGTGIRIKFNKFSKTNIAFDLGYGQLFPRTWIAVNLGEVF
ncbi:MAG: BamA/TamA family outer membrane protein [Bacteroidetes bacterium]|nr:BamA/TamA family outer membrane protein [Bacteroidota bacterium]